MKPNVIIINNDDNVAIALVNIGKGEDIILPDGSTIKALEDIPFSHKVALTDISQNQNIIKYGETIGKVKKEIIKGQWIHTHNIIIEED